MKAEVRSSMLATKVALALFTLITEIARVSVRGLSWRGCSTQALLGVRVRSLKSAGMQMNYYC